MCGEKSLILALQNDVLHNIANNLQNIVIIQMAECLVNMMK